MASMEQIEMDKHRKALDRDVSHLVDKYLKAMEWDIPDVDEPAARKMILDEIKREVGRIESQH